MKILNLFAGIGGNRTLWGDTHDITAVEYDQKIAYIYHKRFPNDTVIIADAYKYLEDHFEEFDFIWASPPCQTHTRIVRVSAGRRYNGEKCKVKLPDFRLWTLINFLNHIFRGNWVVENVISYYKPLIQPTTTIGRHYIWSNAYISPYPQKEPEIDMNNRNKDYLKWLCTHHKIDYGLIEKYSRGLSKRTILRNCVDPEEGKYVLDTILAQTKIVKKIFDFI